MPKKTLRFSALILLGIYALYSLVLYPLQARVANDVVFSDTFLNYLLMFFLPLAENLGLAAAIGFVTYSIYRYGARRSSSLFVVTGLALLFKSVAYFISYSILKGSWQFGKSGKELIASLLITNLVEILLLALVSFLTHLGTKRLKEQNRAKQQACMQLGQDFVPESKLRFHFKNPLFRAVCFGSIPYVAFRLFLFIYPLFTPNIYYWIIIVSFFTAFLIPAVSCFFLSLLCIKLAEREYLRLEAEEKTENDEDAAQA